jgi:hypothetical protein
MFCVKHFYYELSAPPILTTGFNQLQIIIRIPISTAPVTDRLKYTRRVWFSLAPDVHYQSD